MSDSEVGGMAGNRILTAHPLPSGFLLPQVAQFATVSCHLGLMSALIVKLGTTRIALRVNRVACRFVFSHLPQCRLFAPPMSHTPPMSDGLPVDRPLPNDLTSWVQTFVAGEENGRLRGGLKQFHHHDRCWLAILSK